MSNGSKASTTSPTRSTLAHLLKWDSVHGKFDGEIGHDEENIIVRGHKIKIMKERDPGALPWKDLGVEVVLESTGFFTSRDKAELHISKGGAKRVLISAPGEESGRDHLPRNQRRYLRSGEAHHRLERELHDQLPRAAGEGVARQVRDRERAS